jgi:uncharacterized protein YndB with AHSA1/START domain
MSTVTQKDLATQIYRVFIDATPEAIWDAITSPDWNSRYGYHAETEYDLRPGGAYRVLAPVGDPSHDSTQAIIEGEVIESDPPRKLVQTWHALFSPETTAEPFTRLTWEIEAHPNGTSRLTVIHEVGDAPITASLTSGTDPAAGGGWAWIISDLKTLLETGSAFGG